MPDLDPAEPMGPVPPGVLWYRAKLEVYEHGASEPTVDYWVGADLAAAKVRLLNDLAAFDLVRAKADEDLAWLRDQDEQGNAVMSEYRARVETNARLAAWRGFGLWLDSREIARLERGSKGEKGPNSGESVS